MANGNTSEQPGLFSVEVGDGASVLAGGNGSDLLIAEPQILAANFIGLNGSGVTGQVRVTMEGQSLRVQLDASGLEPNQAHAMHIHGLVGPEGTPFDAAPPTTRLDADGDNFLELAEVQRGAGGVLLNLGTAEVGSDGTIHIDQTYDIATADLFPLQFRSVAIHGLSTAEGVGAGTAGEVDGSAGYKAVLPVAAGDLAIQPLQTFAAEDSDGVFMIGGNGQDRLIGGHGDDIMNGSNGTDVLAGGAGDDDLVGGRGGDRFLVGEGKDVVVDFNPAEGDRLVFGLGERGGGGALVLHDTNQGTWIIEGTGLPTDPASEGVLLLGVHGGIAEAGSWFA